MITHRPGALERASLTWPTGRTRLTGAEARMVASYDLGLTELVTSIAVFTPVGAAAIAAVTGSLLADPPLRT